MTESTETNARASIVAYIETRAKQHREAAATDTRDSSFHMGTAIIYDAMASDIKAGLDLP